MIRQPMQRFAQMQATDIDIYRNEIRKTNAEVVRGAPGLASRTHAGAFYLASAPARSPAGDPWVRSGSCCSCFLLDTFFLCLPACCSSGWAPAGPRRALLRDPKPAEQRRVRLVVEP
jgi:hypothetical protein